MIIVSHDFSRKLSITVSGHAPCGMDFVCAAVSVLTDTLASVLSDQKNTAENTVILADGYGQLSSDNPQNLPYFTFGLRGFSLIAEAYPECIEIE